VWFRLEISRAAQWFTNATTLTGRMASEQSLSEIARERRLSTFSVLHFATHAVVDPISPQRSALVLSQADLPDPREAALSGEELVDGLVTAREIMQTWKLSADLVVLSACETALGRNVSGEGYIGFCHAFFQAGARSVIASLWKVDDEATAILMGAFYRHWLGNGERADGDPPSLREGGAKPAEGAREHPSVAASEALRRARLELRDYRAPNGTRPFAHPCYWAGFVIFGDAES
ncbi:MAG: CHAT domain-containing protein, partial [Candidatus Eisenbacteria bacterium]|nr:CHAT domain-containing protein [Candidatus Eisenbacteria bacterium]